ncbi:hypothetical protein OUY22_34155 [Nonomuraea sp. MCN248]|uniref:Uncharacterized protein n=1 Tax=Nonomuraea corallina TaxID=2989783 RepID=A0ABT4SNA3_9ACTN|nr:hypothetical protein [Nonomuraea corallina]MDA0638478.1 hypothetical protein [Nonomuraea corallina]
MNPDHPRRPDPDMTIRHRRDAPAPPPRRRDTPPDQASTTPSGKTAPSQDSDRTQSLDYTPDLLPDVAYEPSRTARRGWRWLYVVGGLLLLVVAVAVAVLLSASS